MRSLCGADTMYKPPKPPIIRMYERKSKMKMTQPMAFWMEPVSNWA